MSNTPMELIDALVELCKDYRGGGFINKPNVFKWLSQFDLQCREAILRELIFILRKSYITRDMVKEFLLKVINIEEINVDIMNNHNEVEFLNIQTKGSSQKDLLRLLNEITKKEFNIKISDCGKKPHTYIYIDDCFYTGNTVQWDIINWVKKNKPYNSKLHLVFIGLYNNNFNYVNNELNKVCAPYNIKIKFWYLKELFNRTSADNTRIKYDCFWAPDLEYSFKTKEYIHEVATKRSKDQNVFHPLLRFPSLKLNETLFSNTNYRNIIEKEFLEKGVYIKNLSYYKNENLRPLGYDKNNTLGFGALFFTYRNIANNCPLVLWGGDMSKHGINNFWFPLFPRKMNS